jgi:hypothetical protein
MESIAASRPRSTRSSRFGTGLRRSILSLIVALIALAATGASYQALAEVVDRRAYPPPGSLVDVGGHRLHIHCLSQGSPTVVLDHIGAGNSAEWG